mmetsp:Transcript_29086/g.74683  ORF Transcript_29086/g.74683 Transcript_29086/m.74683 type:complete len:91 (-) Transcript_29086:735-1007(-)
MRRVEGRERERERDCIAAELQPLLPSLVLIISDSPPLPLFLTSLVLFPPSLRPYLLPFLFAIFLHDAQSGVSVASTQVVKRGRQRQKGAS